MLNELLKAHLSNLACTNSSQAFCLLMQCILQSAQRVQIFWHPQFLRVVRVLEALQVKQQVFVTFLCFSVLLRKALSHCIYVLFFCLLAVRGLPLHVGSSSGDASPFSWLWRSVVLKLSLGGSARLNRLCLEALYAFAVCFSAAWHRDAQGDTLCLAGRACKASLLLPLSGAACHLQVALTSMVGNHLVK